MTVYPPVNRIANANAAALNRQARATAFSVANGSPQDESVRCADLWPVKSKSPLVEGRLIEPWLQELHFAICAASSKQSGGTTGKILSTRLEGISDITTKPPRLQQRSQKVSGDISRNAERHSHLRE